MRNSSQHVIIAASPSSAATEMRKLVNAVIALVVAACVGCEGQRDDAPPEPPASREAAPIVQQPVPPDPSEELELSVVDSVIMTGPYIPADEDVRDSTTTSPIQNIHDPTLTDSIVLRHYPGLVVEVYHVVAHGKNILQSAQVTRDEFLPRFGLRIGMSVDSIVARLGQPTRQEQDTMVYVCAACESGGEESVRFIVRDGAVVRVDFRYWVD